MTTFRRIGVLEGAARIFGVSPWRRIGVSGHHYAAGRPYRLMVRNTSSVLPILNEEQREVGAHGQLI